MKLPCPFCGSMTLEAMACLHAFVACLSCGAHGPITSIAFAGDRPAMIAEAKRLWDSRPDGSLLPLPLPGKGRKEKARKPPSSWALEMAKWLRDLMPGNLRLAADWQNKWAAVFDELIELDKRDDQEIAAVCLWARGDGFWSKNFLSPVKLRQRNSQGAMYYDVWLAALEANKLPSAALKLR